MKSYVSSDKLQLSCFKAGQADPPHLSIPDCAARPSGIEDGSIFAIDRGRRVVVSYS